MQADCAPVHCFDRAALPKRHACANAVAAAQVLAAATPASFACNSAWPFKTQTIIALRCILPATRDSRQPSHMPASCRLHVHNCIIACSTQGIRLHTIDMQVTEITEIKDVMDLGMQGFDRAVAENLRRFIPALTYTQVCSTAGVSCVLHALLLAHTS